ncbi:hypothetical protein BC830DRAFT_1157001 [Chytriomyces sp. MP71]|nr:hypothetical protein BC830DRAFT_1157001 [Chytriomyces sp. MP71]
MVVYRSLLSPAYSRPMLSTFSASRPNVTMVAFVTAPDVLNTAVNPITTFIVGCAFENSVSGLISTLVHLLMERRRKRVNIIFAIMSVFNMLSLVYNSLFLFSFFLGEKGCSGVDLTTNLFSHCYYVVFDFFILFKSWVVSGYNGLFLYIASATILHRVAWALFDLSTSYSEYSSGSCNFYQNPLSGSGYPLIFFPYSLNLSSSYRCSVGDILCDLLSTLGCLYFCRRRLKEALFLTDEDHFSLNSDKFQKLLIVFMQENVLRSIFVLTINILILWCNDATNDPFVLPLVYAVESYIFARSLNLEFVWHHVRTKVQEEEPQPFRASSSPGMSGSTTSPASVGRSGSTRRPSGHGMGGSTTPPYGVGRSGSARRTSSLGMSETNTRKALVGEAGKLSRENSALKNHHGQ